MRALLVVAVLGPLAAACSDPTFDVSIEYEQLAGVAAADQLDAQVATLTVSVVDAVSAGPAAGLGRDATCDDVAYGRIPIDVLEGARRASVGALDTPHLSGVPRLGQKLVIVEARTRGGRRVGGGCTQIGDVESDTTVPVIVEVAPRARVFTREEVTNEPTPVNLVVTAAWNDLLVLGGRKVVAELYSTGGVTEMPVEPTLDNGLTRTPDFSLTDPGPAQTLIRVRWAEDFIRVPAFVQWPAMPVVGNAMAHVALAIDDGSRLRPSWVSGVVTLQGTTAWTAAALQKRPAMTDEEVVVVRFVNGRLFPVTPIAVGGTRAMALWNGELATVIDDGWHTIDMNGLSAQPTGTAPGAGAATEMHAFDGCDGAPGAGLLVRRRESTAPNAVDRFYAYSSPGVPAPAGSPLANLADALDPGTDEIVGDACVSLDGTPVRIVATRGDSLGLVAWLSNGMQPLKLTNVQNATSFVRNDTALLAAAEGTITGPRVRAFRLASLPIGGNNLTGFVAVDDVDTELATLPLALAVGQLDGDARYDVIAALPSLNGPRLQASFGRDVAGEPLASLSPPLPGGRTATNPILRLENVDGDTMKHDELVVMTDEGLDVLCFDVRASAGGMQCASAP